MIYNDVGQYLFQLAVTKNQWILLFALKDKAKYLFSLQETILVPFTPADPRSNTGGGDTMFGKLDKCKVANYLEQKSSFSTLPMQATLV